VTLLVEIAERGGWRRLGELGADDPAGSLSHNTEEGREIIQFRCNGDHSVIERSIGGARGDRHGAQGHHARVRAGRPT
jgi:hypothetical protein